MKPWVEAIGINLLILIPILVLFSQPLWIEPDSTGLFSNLCDPGAIHFEIPILSKTILSFLPCSIFVWKIAHVLSIVLILLSLTYLLHKNNIEKDYIVLVGLSYFFLFFIASFEDDHLAIPLVIFLIARYYVKPSLTNLIVYAIGSLIAFLLWKGSLVVLVIAFLCRQNIILGIIGSIIPILLGLIGSDPSNSNRASEQTLGRGFITNNILTWIVLILWRKKTITEDLKPWFAFLFAFLIVSFVYPKFGFILVIPSLVLIGKGLESIEWKRIFWIAGLIGLTLGVSVLLLVNHPTPQSIQTIQEAVELQQKGFTVYNEWSVGYWFQYYGGKTIVAGGNQNKYSVGVDYLPEHYWLGYERKECETLKKGERFSIQFCPESEGFI